MSGLFRNGMFPFPRKENYEYKFKDPVNGYVYVRGAFFLLWLSLAVKGGFFKESVNETCSEATYSVESVLENIKDLKYFSFLDNSEGIVLDTEDKYFVLLFKEGTRPIRTNLRRFVDLKMETPDVYWKADNVLNELFFNVIRYTNAKVSEVTIKRFNVYHPDFNNNYCEFLEFALWLYKERALVDNKTAELVRLNTPLVVVIGLRFALTYELSNELGFKRTFESEIPSGRIAKLLGPK